MTGSSEKDRDLDAYLKGDSPLSRAYAEEARELPPAHVDARILAEARRADAGPVKAAAPFSGNWMVPVSAMAVIVLTVSVVALLPEREPGFLPGGDEAVQPAARPEGAANDAKRERRSLAEEAAETKSVAPESATESSAAPGRGTATTAEPNRLRPQTSDVPREEFPATLKSRERVEGESPAPEAARSPAGTDLRQQRADEAAPDADSEFTRRLAQIQTLVEQGEVERAREALATLRRDYPNRELPPTILRALEQDG